jgi:Uma2 family endonuclease
MGDMSIADAWLGPRDTPIVSPAPGMPHQRAAAMLCHALELACPEDLVVCLSAGVELGVHGAWGPDAVVARRPRPGETRFLMPPLLVAEILSPDCAPGDLNLKKAAYERLGVPSYWMIDPDPERPSLRAFRLVRGRYREAAQVEGDVPFRADQPFPVEIVPSRLVALRPQP